MKQEQKKNGGGQNKTGEPAQFERNRLHSRERGGDQQYGTCERWTWSEGVINLMKLVRMIVMNWGLATHLQKKSRVALNYR